ncbi:MAG TPA: hypothetical protein VF185_03025 [Patescibacteria group bacterium]
MKKYLPIILLIVGILVLVGVVVLVKKATQGPTTENTPVEEETAPELAKELRPFTSLIPKSDGHWLKLRVEDMKVPNAVSLDYELLYKTGDGRTQGVPGTVAIKGVGLIERDLLLGSESSGKFRYDQGVEKGTLTLRFRNDKGKLVAKLVTDWHLQSDGPELTSVDGKFTYTLNKTATGVWFVTMMPFGTKQGASNVVVASGDYAIFSSDGLAHSGK